MSPSAVQNMARHNRPLPFKKHLQFYLTSGAFWEKVWQRAMKITRYQKETDCLRLIQYIFRFFHLESFSWDVSCGTRTIAVTFFIVLHQALSLLAFFVDFRNSKACIAFFVFERSIKWVLSHSSSQLESISV